MESESKEHVIAMEVRDYECDMADGVNNSVYYNYLEHARHSLLKAGGINFAELARQRIGLVILKAEVEFLRSLVSGDRFSVHTRLYRVSKIRFEFHQQIFREPDRQLMLKAKVLGVTIDANDKPGLPAELEALVMPLCSTLPEVCA